MFLIDLFNFQKKTRKIKLQLCYLCCFDANDKSTFFLSVLCCDGFEAVWQTHLMWLSIWHMGLCAGCAAENKIYKDFFRLEFVNGILDNCFFQVKSCITILSIPTIEEKKHFFTNSDANAKNMVPSCLLYAS